MASGTFGVLNVFNHETHEWVLFKGQLQQWFLANEITSETDKSGAKRRAILLSSLYETTYRLIRDLALPKDVGTLTYQEVINLFDGHFQTKRCTFAERHKFHCAVQKSEESLAQWSARVRGLAMECGFPVTSLEDTLRDRFVLGLACGPERDRLFNEPMEQLTLQKALQLAEGVRCAREGARQGAGAPALAPVVDVHKVAARDRTSSSWSGAKNRDNEAGSASAASSRSSEQCSVCGYFGHNNKKCRFKNALCRKCGIKGHMKRVCGSNKMIGGNQHFLQCCSDDGDDGGVWSLRNVSISVPRGVLSGEGAAVTMRCQYDLEGAALYSIRWYRADTEFYRFVPREMPPSMVFPLPGANVDLSASDRESVRVVGLHRRLSGIFACEVSADAPLFHTDIRAAPLTIVDPPFRAPRLSVPRATYVRGGVLRANCSVDAAYPAANLTWTVDGHKIAEHVSPPPQSELDFSERGATSVLELTVLEAEHYRVGLSYTSGLIDRHYPDHYVYDNKETFNKDPESEVLRYALVAPPSGQFQLRCVATIYDVYARAGEPATLREDAPRPASVTGEDSAGNSRSADALLTALAALSSALLALLL